MKYHALLLQFSISQNCSGEFILRCFDCFLALLSSSEISDEVEQYKTFLN